MHFKETRARRTTPLPQSCSVAISITGFTEKGEAVYSLEEPAHAGVQFWLSVIACSPDNLWLRLAAANKSRHIRRPLCKQRLVKMGSRVVKHARYDRLVLVEGHLSRRLLGMWYGVLSCWPWQAGT